MPTFKRVYTTACLGGFCVGLGFIMGRASKNEINLFTQRELQKQSCESESLQSSLSKSGSRPSHSLYSLFTLSAASPFTTSSESPVVSVQQTANAVQNMVKYGFPSTDNLRSYEDFMLSYDRRTRVPNWVLEHLTPEKVTAKEGVERLDITF